MSDFLLEWDETQNTADLGFDGNDFESDEGLHTAVVISLFTDRQAEAGDPLPEGENDRRGWWADGVPVVEGDKIGSRLWLLDRAKDEPDVLPRAESYAREALQWLLDDKVASSMDATAAFLTGRNGYTLAIKISRPSRADVSFQFDVLWKAEEAR